MRRWVLSAAHRGGSLLLILFATSFIVFGAMYLAPGSPESFLVRGDEVSAETLLAIRKQYHLDEPFVTQYLLWLGGAMRGDFGLSIQFRQPVADMIVSRLPTTAMLVAYAALLIFTVGVLAGVLAAVKRGAVDVTAVVASSVAMATPSFVAAMAMTSLFAVWLGWFPAFGAGRGFLDRVWHLTLPAIALALSSSALVLRTTRTALIGALSKEYVDTARVRGFSSGRVIWAQAFRGAVVPVVALAGLLTSGLLVTTTIVETIFGLNGLGSLLVDAVNVKDFPVVQAVILIIVAVFVLSNLIVDLVYPLLDPRVRSGETDR